MDITIKVHVGKNSRKYIETISKIRIDVFKEFPYLYSSNLEYENEYLRSYMANTRGMITIAKVNGNFAGISSGIPLASEASILADAKSLFADKMDDYYYFGEVIVLQQFRGLGLTTQLFAAQEKIVKEWGFKKICFLTVIRESDHLLKPIDYQQNDPLWAHLGFTRNNIHVTHHWPTIHPDQSVKDVKNILEFWEKQIIYDAPKLDRRFSSDYA